MRISAQKSNERLRAKAQNLSSHHEELRSHPRAAARGLSAGNKKCFKNGFTLVELIIVVSIISILAGFMIPNFGGYIKSQNLNQGLDTVVTDLRSLQNKALTGVKYIDDISTTHWGVKFSANANTYSYFLSDGNLSADCNNLTTVESVSRMLPGDVVTKNSVCVFFTFDNGDAVTYPPSKSVILGQLNDNSTCVSVTINSSGGIVEGSVSCP